MLLSFFLGGRRKERPLDVRVGAMEYLNRMATPMWLRGAFGFEVAGLLGSRRAA